MSVSIEQDLETLLRGEIAAAETYHQALDGADESDAAPLRAINCDHGDAIRFLYRKLMARGFDAPTSSGAWGLFARTVEGTAKLLGERAALAALREGERNGLAHYQQVLATNQLPPDCTGYVVRRLIPAQHRHIDVLSRLIDQR